MIAIVLGFLAPISIYMTICASMEESVSPDVKAASTIKAALKRKVANDSYSRKVEACRMLSGVIKRKMVHEEKKYSTFKYLISLICEVIRFVRMMIYPIMIMVYIIIFMMPVFKLIFQIIMIKIRILIFILRMIFM